MDLRAKLKQIVREDERPQSAARQAKKKGVPVSELLPGELTETVYGSAFAARYLYPMEYQHGIATLSSLLDYPSEPLVNLSGDHSLLGFDFRKAVFIDTETTGLAGGTGTYAFLVGAGYFHGGNFIIRQFFMDDYDQEAAMLASLSELLAQFSGIVSFNGKSFDLPLIMTRYIYSKMEPPIREDYHVDLLHMARRIWRYRLASCSLASLEENVLGVKRVNDVPGYLIPGLYFDYLQSKDGRILERVFYHNKLDLLSMVTLVSHMLSLYVEPHKSAQNAYDLFALGHALEHRGELTRALEYYEACLELNPGPNLENLALKKASLVLKRLGNLERAVSIWQDMISNGDNMSTFPHIELAKHLEHRKKDFARAAAVVEQAIKIAHLKYSAGEKEKPDLDALVHRLRRIKRKQKRSPGR